MTNLAFIWQAFIARPLWQLVAVQIALVGAMAMAGYYSVIHNDIAMTDGVQQRIRAVELSSAQFAQRLAALPPLLTLKQQRDALAETPEAIDVKGLAAQLSAPLAASGATLLSLQQQVSRSSVSTGQKPFATPLSPPWFLLVSTNYHDALTLLDQMMNLPQSLRIQALTISRKNTVLQVEMALSFPLFEEDDNE